LRQEAVCDARLVRRLYATRAMRHGGGMAPSLTDLLCTQCGLCCDGSLFADVELSGPAEAAGLEILGLEVEDDDSDGRLLVQPCAALEGKRCAIYAHRPRCCRTFECRLLQDVRHGAVSIARAQQHIVATLSGIGRVRALIAELGGPIERLPLKEQCADALVHPAAATPALDRQRAALEVAMTEVETSIRTTFLGDTGYQ
jgi:uncharacterized protein